MYTPASEYVESQASSPVALELQAREPPQLQEQQELLAPELLEQLKIVIVGHVDHGKSTLIGRLIYDTGNLPEGKLEQLTEVARRRGTPFEFANLMDGLQAERDQNITIDTAQIWLRTPQRHYVIIDAPGHKEFLKNMVTGAASAHAALLLVDAAAGVREQTRRHGYLLQLLGLRQVAVVVNKMDLVGYAQPAYQRVVQEAAAMLRELGLRASHYVPIAARDGDNLATRSQHTPWYTGPTVLEALAEFQVPADKNEQPLRLALQDVYRFDERRILAGRIESGTLRVGDRLLFLPSGKSSTVASIERWSAPRATAAVAGESVGITLEEQLFVERGQIAVAIGDTARTTSELRASVFWMGRKPLQLGRRYRLKLLTQEVDCELTGISKVIDAATLASSPRSEVGRYEVAELSLRTRTPILADRYQDLSSSGRFVLVDDLEVAGGGTVSALVPLHAEAALPRVVAPARSGQGVQPAARAARNGHSGRIVYVVDAQPEQRARAAAELEQALFERGAHAFLLGEGRTAARAGAALLAEAGLLAIVPVARPPRRPQHSTVIPAAAAMQAAADELLARGA
jgi:bifunctional enzyme CysN/CysC